MINHETFGMTIDEYANMARRATITYRNGGEHVCHDHKCGFSLCPWCAAAGVDLLPPSQSLLFYVSGTPAPGGSKNANAIKIGANRIRELKKTPPHLRGKYRRTCLECGFTGFVSVTDAGKNNAGWKKAVQVAARNAVVASSAKWPYRGPVDLTVLFAMPRPKAHYRTGKNAHLLKNDAPGEHTFKPDCTKLLRSTEDAMSEVVWTDDDAIVTSRHGKMWADGIAPGAYIHVRTGHEARTQRRLMLEGFLTLMDPGTPQDTLTQECSTNA